MTYKITAATNNCPVCFNREKSYSPDGYVEHLKTHSWSELQGAFHAMKSHMILLETFLKQMEKMP